MVDFNILPDHLLNTENSDSKLEIPELILTKFLQKNDNGTKYFNYGRDIIGLVQNRAILFYINKLCLHGFLLKDEWIEILEGDKYSSLVRFCDGWSCRIRRKLDMIQKISALK